MPAISFEFFPPKTDEQRAQLDRAAAAAQGAPAGLRLGDLRRRRLDPQLHRRNGGAPASRSMASSVAPHLSCMGGTRAEIAAVARRLPRRRLPPPGRAARRPALGHGLGTATSATRPSWCSFIREHSGDHFHIEVAAYPETHPQADDALRDLHHFKAKVDAGANGAITQYFFNPDAYFRFVDDVRRLGVDVPIVPGIMPISNFSQLKRFSDMCGAEIPRWIAKRMQAHGDDAEAVRALGAEVVAQHVPAPARGRRAGPALLHAQPRPGDPGRAGTACLSATSAALCCVDAPRPSPCSVCCWSRWSRRRACAADATSIAASVPTAAPVFTDQACADTAGHAGRAQRTRDPMPARCHRASATAARCAPAASRRCGKAYRRVCRANANRMAGLMLWSGYSRGAVVADIRSLNDLMKQPLLDIDVADDQRRRNAAGRQDLTAAEYRPVCREPAARTPRLRQPPGPDQLVLHTASTDGLRHAAGAPIRRGAAGRLPVAAQRGLMPQAGPPVMMGGPPLENRHGAAVPRMDLAERRDQAVGRGHHPRDVARPALRLVGVRGHSQLRDARWRGDLPPHRPSQAAVPVRAASTTWCCRIRWTSWPPPAAR